MRKKKAIINVIAAVVLQIITIICGFIVPKLIITNFGSNVNGLLNSIVQFLAYITLLESGFGPVVKSILYKPIANKNKDEIQRILKTTEKFFKKIAAIFLIYIVGLCIFLPFTLSKEFDTGFTLSLVIIIAISTFAEYYFGMTYKIYLQSEQKNYVISIVHAITLILNTITVIILIKLGANIQIIKLFSSIIFILRPVLINIYVKKKFNINLKGADENYKIKQKWDGLAQHIAYVVHTNTDVVLLTLCCKNISEVSVYSVYLMVINKIKDIVKSFTGGIDATFGDMIAKEEKKSLKKNFEKYEVIYLTIATILFSTTMFLIIPFVSVYTKEIKDVNYIRPVFAYIIVIAEFISTIRQPYNDLVKTAGHFKETQIGAWIETISNILISVILVWNFGIIGVAIGTLIAMTIRTIEFIYHCSKYILNRSIWNTLKKILVIIFELLIITIIMNLIPNIQILNYYNWIIQGIIVFSISSIVVLCINFFLYKDIIIKKHKVS
ncbi:MAG: polysaccharide biosynthesis C-terminal domain-containing protein [Clostridia bacterium]|nr:polysaccharide biosynthesis C-terminal domain-containing protein [Clostridia bacterium]